MLWTLVELVPLCLGTLFWSACVHATVALFKCIRHHQVLAAVITAAPSSMFHPTAFLPSNGAWYFVLYQTLVHVMPIMVCG
jgi:hypothetical protein